MSKRKKIIIAAVIGGLILIIGIVSVVIINQNSTKKEQPAVVAPTKEKADDLKQKAVEAIKSKDYAAAKESLQEAKKQYDAIGDKESSVSIDMQLYFIEHPTTPPTTAGEQATPVNTGN